jgi:hypothetical protein
MAKLDLKTETALEFYPDIKNLILAGKLKLDGQIIAYTENNQNIPLFKISANDPFIKALVSDKGEYETYYPRSMGRDIRKKYLFCKQDSEGEKPSYAFIESRYTNRHANGHTSLTVMANENNSYNIFEVGFRPKKTWTRGLAETLAIPFTAEIIGDWSNGKNSAGQVNHAFGIKFPNKHCAMHLKYDSLIDALSFGTKKPEYHYQALSIRGTNCTGYTMRLLKDNGVYVKKELAIPRALMGLIFSPGDLAKYIEKHFKESSWKDPRKQVMVCNKDGLAIHREPVQIFTLSTPNNREHILINMADLRRLSDKQQDSMLILDDKYHVYADLKYLLHKLYNQPVKEKFGTGHGFGRDVFGYHVTPDIKTDSQFIRPDEKVKPFTFSVGAASISVEAPTKNNTYEPAR